MLCLKAAGVLDLSYQGYTTCTLYVRLSKGSVEDAEGEGDHNGFLDVREDVFLLVLVILGSYKHIN